MRWYSPKEVAEWRTAVRREAMKRGRDGGGTEEEEEEDDEHVSDFDEIASGDETGVESGCRFGIEDVVRKVR